MDIDNSIPSTTLQVMVKSLFRFLLLCLCVMVAAGGCSEKSAPHSKPAIEAFAAASPKLKADWESVCAAAAATNYVTVILTGRKMQGVADLTSEQRTAVNEILTVLSEQMTAAALKGDAAALKAIEEIRKGWR
jgi:hypothetical protein